MNRERSYALVIVTGQDCELVLPKAAGSVVLQLRIGQRLLWPTVWLRRIPAHCQPVKGVFQQAIRLLAFVDQAWQLRRRPQAPVPVLSDLALEQPQVMANWLLHGLLSDCRQAHAVAAVLAQHPDYGLLRFLAVQNGTCAVEALARRYGLSDAQFRRRCRQALGRPLKQELRRLRAGHALFDYSGRERTLTDVAIANGFASSSHFCNEIRALLGYSPTQIYRPL